jgi:hypothetical protein
MAYNPETHRQKTVTFPWDIYDDICSLAEKEDRDETKEIIHLLKFAIDNYPVKPDRPFVPKPKPKRRR